MFPPGFLKHYVWVLLGNLKMVWKREFSSHFLLGDILTSVDIQSLVVLYIKESWWFKLLVSCLITW